MARAVVYRPDVLLLDEPLSNLDVKLRVAMRAELKRLQQVLGITTIFVTHDQQEALALSDRIAVMRDGRMEQVGTPHEIYESPRSLFVADFVGATNLLGVSCTPSTPRPVRSPSHRRLTGDRDGAQGRRWFAGPGRREAGAGVSPRRRQRARRTYVAGEIESVAYLGAAYSYVSPGSQRVEARCARGDINRRHTFGRRCDRSDLRFDPESARVFAS